MTIDGPLSNNVFGSGSTEYPPLVLVAIYYPREEMELRIIPCASELQPPISM